MAIKISGNTVIDNSDNFIGNKAVFRSNDHIVLPTGTTAQRTASAPDGALRYNTENFALEVYAGSWLNAVANAVEFSGSADQTMAEDTSYSAGGQLDISAVSSINQAGMTYTLVGGTLPPGLTITTTGAGAAYLTGTTNNITTTTTYTFTINADDGTKSANQIFTYTMTATNAPPTFTDTAQAGGTSFGTNYGSFTHQVTTTDPEGEVVTFANTTGGTALATVAGGSITVSSTGLITFTTVPPDDTVYTLTVRATDASGATADRTYTMNASSPSLGSDEQAVGTGQYALGGRGIEYWQPGSHTFTMPGGIPNNRVRAIAIGGGRGGSNGYNVSNGSPGGAAVKLYTIPAAGTATLTVGSAGNSDQNGTSSTFTYGGTTITGTAGTQNGQGQIGVGGDVNYRGGTTNTTFTGGGGGGAGAGGNGGAGGNPLGQPGSGPGAGGSQPSDWVSGSGGGGGGVVSTYVATLGGRGGTGFGADPGHNPVGWGTPDPMTYATNPQHGRFGGGGGGEGPNTTGTTCAAGSPGGGGAGGHVGPGNQGGRGYVLIEWSDTAPL